MAGAETVLSLANDSLHVVGGGLSAAASSTLALVRPQHANESHELTPAERASIELRTDSYGNQVNVLLSGCRTNGEIVSRMVGPTLDRFGASATLVYPKQGCSYESIRDNLIDVRRRFGQETPFNLIAISMGGMLVNRLYQDERFRDGFGPVESLVIDSAPSAPGDIRLMAKAGLDFARVASRLPLHDASAWFAQKVSQRATNFSRETIMSEIDPERINPDIAYEHRAFTHSVGLGVIDAQYRTIMSHEVTRGSLARFAGRVVYLTTRNDAVVNTRRAAAKYAEAVGDRFSVVINDDLTDTFHATVTDHPGQLEKFLSPA